MIANFNLPLLQQDPEAIFPLFRFSYHWIAPLGLLATVTVGSIVGWLFDKKDDWKMDGELYTPMMWRCLPREAIERAGDTRRAVLAKADSPRPTSPLMLGRHSDKVR